MFIPVGLAMPIPGLLDKLPGIRTKPLARFNTGGPDVEMIRVDTGATLSGGRAEVHRMWVVFSGSGECGGRGIAEGTFIYSPPGSDIPPLRADQQVIIYSSRFETRRVTRS